MIEYGKNFDAEIKKQRAKTILYETWALQNKLEQQTAISNAYEGLSRELNARLAPVGSAWQTALRSDTKLILHDMDHKHPNATGTYLGGVRFLCNHLRQESRRTSWTNWRLDERRGPAASSHCLEVCAGGGKVILFCGRR